MGRAGAAAAGARAAGGQFVPQPQPAARVRADGGGAGGERLQAALPPLPPGTGLSLQRPPVRLSGWLISYRLCAPSGLCRHHVAAQPGGSAPSEGGGDGRPGRLWRLPLPVAGSHQHTGADPPAPLPRIRPVALVPWNSAGQSQQGAHPSLGLLLSDRCATDVALLLPARCVLASVVDLYGVSLSVSGNEVVLIFLRR